MTGGGGDAPYGLTRWLVVIATGTYASGSGLPDLPGIDAEVAEARAAFQALGYSPERHIALVNEEPVQTERRVEDFLAARGPDDVVAIYVTGHGEVRASPAGARLHLHTISSRRGDARRTLTLERLLTGLTAAPPGEGLRNLILVLDVCGAGAGVQAAIAEFRTSMPPLFVEPHLPAGAYVVATARTADSAIVSAFTQELLASVASSSVAPRSQQYLELGPLVAQLQTGLNHQVIETASIGQQGPNVCLPNPRHHLRGVNWQEMNDWWEPRARGMSPAEAAEPDHDRTWRFTGRLRANQRLAGWCGDDADFPLLIVTAAPGSGKSTVLARAVALTVPDFRRAHSNVVADPADSLPPEDFFFTAAIWAHAASAGTIRSRIMDALGLSSWGDLATLAAPAASPRPVVAIDALDEAEDAAREVRQVVRPLAFAAQRGALRLLVATRRQPVGHDPGHGDSDADLIGLLASTGPNEVMNLDDSGWWAIGDIAGYVELMLIEAPSAQRASVYAADTAVSVRRVLARRIEERAKPSYLLAALVARRHSRDRTLAAPSSPLWASQFPASIGEALRQDLESAYGYDSQRIYALLRPLGYAQGVGLPREQIGGQDLWAILATKLAEDSPDVFTGRDIDELLDDRAGTYLIAQTDIGGSLAYRFHHEALAQHFAPAMQRPQNHRTIVGVLLAPVTQDHQRPRWELAGSYLRRALPGHAREAGMLADLLAPAENAGLLAICDPDAWLIALAGNQQPDMTAVRALLQVLRQRLRQMTPDDRARLISSLALAAPTVRYLAAGLVGPEVRPRASVAAIQPATEHLVITTTFEPNRPGPVAVAAERDGRPLLLTSDGPFADVWDPASGEPLDLLGQHDGPIEAFCPFVDSDGFPSLAAFDYEGTVTVWDLTLRSQPRQQVRLPRSFFAVAGHARSGQDFIAGLSVAGCWTWFPGTQRAITESPAGIGHVTGLAVVTGSSSGDLLVIAASGRIVVWNPETGSVEADLTVSGDPNLSVTGGREALLAVENPRTEQAWLWRNGDREATPLALTAPDTGWVTSAEVINGAAGTVIAIGYSGGAVSLWPSNDPQDVVLLQARGPTLSAHSAALDHTPTEPAVLAVVDARNDIHVWDIDHLRWLCTLPSPEPISDIQLGRYRNGHPYVVTVTDTSVDTWPVTDMSKAAAPDLHRGSVTDLACIDGLPGGVLVATAGTEGTIRIWDGDGTLHHTYSSLAAPDYAPRLHIDSSPVRLHLLHTNEYGVLDFDLLKPEQPPQRLSGISVTDSALCILPGGQRVLGLLAGGDVQLRDPVSGRLLIDMPGSGLRLYRLALWPLDDDHLLAAAGSDLGRTWLWSVRLTAREFTEHLLDGNRGNVTTLAFYRDDQQDAYLVTGCRGGVVDLWNATSGRLLHRLLDRPGSVIDTKFLPSHSAPYVAATYRNAQGSGELAIWHADSGTEVPIESPLLPGAVSIMAGGTASVPIVCALRGDAVDIIHLSGRNARTDRWPLPMTTTVAKVCGHRLFVGGAGGFIGIDIF
jgi:WD40 repeat protein